MDLITLTQFAERYTAAWCSQNAASVASFFEKDGSLTINEGEPAIGRAAITSAAQSFMTAFPDLVVEMDKAREKDGRVRYDWTLHGTSTGPGGSGRAVRISGYEEWTMAPSGLIVKSLGHFDEADYHRQVTGL